MIDDDAVNILSISPIDVIDNLDDEDYNLSEEQIQSILKLDNDIIYNAIYGATKHMELSDYYHMAIEDAIFYLKNYIKSNEEECNDKKKL